MNEDKDRMEMELLALALERCLPVFGICRGMQLVAAALGGAQLLQHRPRRQGHAVGQLGADGAVLTMGDRAGPLGWQVLVERPAQGCRQRTRRPGAL